MFAWIKKLFSKKKKWQPSMPGRMPPASGGFVTVPPSVFGVNDVHQYQLPDEQIKKIREGFVSPNQTMTKEQVERFKVNLTSVQAAKRKASTQAPKSLRHADFDDGILVLYPHQQFAAESVDQPKVEAGGGSSGGGGASSSWDNSSTSSSSDSYSSSSDTGSSSCD